MSEMNDNITTVRAKYDAELPTISVAAPPAEQYP
jgi:hypothetical protein